MKKVMAIFLGVLFLLMLCGCSGSNKVYTYETNRYSLEVNQKEQTISDGVHTYEYTFSGNKSQYRIDITYPNGATYYWNQSDMTGSGGWSDDYNGIRYVDGEILCRAIVERAPEPASGGKIVAALLVIGGGAFYALAPEVAWHWNIGWRFRDAEPSDMALRANRIVGVVVLILGLIVLFT